MKKKYMRGSITTYVMLMFGLVAVLLLMGFNPPFFAQTVGGGEGGQVISEPGFFDLGTMMMATVFSVFQALLDNPIWGIIAPAVTIISMYIIVKLGGQYIIAYVVPLLFLVLFANIFVFPTSSIGTDLPTELSLITFSFLNLFLILSYLEFVRGNP